MKKIKIIDLFAGPGGLGEGFSNFTKNSNKPFQIAISIEKEKFAHQTLSLRSFYRQFITPPNEYYQYLQGKIDRNQLFDAYPEQSDKALNEAWMAELGAERFPHEDVVKKIKSQLPNKKNDWIIIGGPPCQAYSLVGRSKMRNQKEFGSDPRHTLYLEYLKIIADFKPAVFVMENVKGMLSSKFEGELIFDKILKDLKNPNRALNSDHNKSNKNETYTIYSVTSDKPADGLDKKDFIIKSEEYGIPQARHRVILLGVRNDISARPGTLKVNPKKYTVKSIIGTLPKLRSGLSKFHDTYDNWLLKIQDYSKDVECYKRLNRGGNYVPSESKPTIYKDWFYDPNLKGVLNHETRAHISSDLHRYHYIATYAQEHKISPKLEQFPTELLPNHKNVKRAIKGKSLFNDRFRVQCAGKPATTITSHISKDGHYFIHYDPKQCRSLTVREAARIQTFPDNYKFEGPRTSQYQQVGNAVPPLLAKQIAEIVFDLMKRHCPNA